MSSEEISTIMSLTTLDSDGAKKALAAANGDVEVAVRIEMSKFSKIEKRTPPPPTNNQKVFKVFRKFLDEAEESRRKAGNPGELGSDSRAS